MEKTIVDLNKYYVIGEAVTKGINLEKVGKKYFDLDHTLTFFDNTEFKKMSEAKKYLENNYEKATERKIAPYNETKRIRFYKNGMLFPEAEYRAEKEKVGAVIVKGDYLAMYYKENGFDWR